MRLKRALRGSLRPVIALLLVVLSACGGEYPQSSIDPKTDFARIIQDLYGMITWISLVILVVVWAILAYVLVRFRERPDSARPKQIHGHLGMEIAWTIVPALIVVAIAVPTVQAVFATQRLPEDAMVVEVVGHQFWWEFRYPDRGVVTANELHLPVGRPVSLRLHSADVIHSFWVPMLGGKRDVNPLRAVPEGREPEYNWLHFTIDEPGVYMGQCAEFCGPSHSLMGMRVVAHEEDEFQAWLDAWEAGGAAGAGASADTTGGTAGDTLTADTATAAAADTVEATDDLPTPSMEVDPQDGDRGTAPADGSGARPSGMAERQEAERTTVRSEGDAASIAEGREIFLRSTCIACHAIEGTTAQGQVGPDLTLLGRRSTIAAGWMDNSVDNLVEWITSPRSIKPGALMPGVAEAGGNWPPTNLSEDQVVKVAQYLYSLR